MKQTFLENIKVFWNQETQNQKTRIELLESYINQLDIYLDAHKGICRGSLLHLEAKVLLCKNEAGDRIAFQEDLPNEK